MYALEKRERNSWRRYALCNRRWPLDKVKKQLTPESRWRVIYAPDAQLCKLPLKRAA